MGDFMLQEKNCLIWFLTINIKIWGYGYKNIQEYIYYKLEAIELRNNYFMEKCHQSRRQQLHNRLIFFTQKFIRSLQPSSFFYQSPTSSTYAKAKNAFVQKNYLKSLQYYVKAASQCENLSSCIYDFASILHQLGFTHHSLLFLKEIALHFPINNKICSQFRESLATQLLPSKKQFYKNILLDLRDVHNAEITSLSQFLSLVFANTWRIRKSARFPSLNFQNEEENGRYLVLNFDSFSAAKKTMGTFQECEWFGIDKYWMSVEYKIVWQAKDGSEFEGEMKEVGKREVKSLEEYNENVVDNIGLRYRRF